MIFNAGKLWTAPEILRDPGSFSLLGTKTGDVYSFAVILHEMLFRKGAFFSSEEPTPSPKGIFTVELILLFLFRPVLRRYSADASTRFLDLIFSHFKV